LGPYLIFSILVRMTWEKRADIDWKTVGQRLRALRGSEVKHSELVSGVLVSSEYGVGPYPVHFSKVGLIGTDMKIEDDSGFVCWQPRSALALLLRPPSRGEGDGPVRG